MITKTIWRWLSVAVVMSLTLSVAGMTVQASTIDKPASPQVEKLRLEPFLGTLPGWAERPVEPEAALAETDPAPPPPSSPQLSPIEPVASTATRGINATRATTEVFTNTWSYSTIGMAYDSGREYVRYAHESQSSTHNPTVYDVDRVSHNAVFSFALSTVNSTWPWQLDNRTGVGYDYVSDTYFLPDYNGDLSYADDNIVEVDVNGNIANAWEMDDEVGSNDSSDGSEIDEIIDIAVVPGTTPRYFATAAYDDNVVYEIELSKTGVWWAPNSWRTVATCTVPFWGTMDDNLGIDYDAEHDVLYHSNWDTTTLVLTDLTCQNGQPMNIALDDAGAPIQPFDCPGAGGYNSGVTAIEGQSQVWVTDFSSDQTTICPSPFTSTPVEPGWRKIVVGPDGTLEPWHPDLTVQTQTSDTIMVVDIITATEALTLTELWNPEHLRLTDWNVDPPVGHLSINPGQMQFNAPPGPPEVIRITKWFHVEPCNWITTTVEEFLEIDGIVFDPRPFLVAKTPSALEITSDYFPGVFQGTVASFTLTYSNTGGFENEATIINTFPITAPFILSDPPPDEVYPDGSVEWRLGSLATDDSGTIDVYFFVDETAVPSNTIAIWDGIYDHAGNLIDWIISEFHIEEYTPPPIEWGKFVNDVEWYPGISITGEYSDTFIVEDTVFPTVGQPFVLLEEWDPAHLSLVMWEIFPPDYAIYVFEPQPGLLVLDVPLTGMPEPITLIKEFHIESCTWEGTVLWEELWNEGIPEFRPVEVFKIPPNLWITSTNNSNPNVYGGELVSFTLNYGNQGGNEEFVIVRNEFPPEATFLGSEPWPNVGGPGDPWVEWVLPDDPGQITVTVEIAPNLPPSTTIDIYDYILDHARREEDWTQIRYHVPPPEWWKWVNGEAWNPDLGVMAYTSDTITVTDVISTGSNFSLAEFWNPERLFLQEYFIDPPIGIVTEDPGFISWEFPEGPPGVVTMTKIFHIEPCTWTYTILWEELWLQVDDQMVEWERRPVHIDKPSPELWIDSFFDVSVIPGQVVTFELEYTNPITADREFGAWIENVFPPEAPFLRSDPMPEPENWAPDGSWVLWDLPPLEPGDSGIITVAVQVSTTVPISTPIEIWDGIFNHAGELEDDTVIFFHVAPPDWMKWVNGEPWNEGITIQTQTSDTITITDVIYVPEPGPDLLRAEGETMLEENWDPAHLSLLPDWEISAGSVVSNVENGWMQWFLPVGEPGIYTITKVFHVEPCDWDQTFIQEELWLYNEPHPWIRMVTVTKQLPILWIDNDRVPEVFAGQEATFTLAYGNRGGLESSGWVTNTFPPEAPFLRADPMPKPENIAPDGSWALWDFTNLASDETRFITVTVDITDTLVPSETVTIYDYIYDHVGVEQDWTVITYHVEPPEPFWVKEIWVDGTPHTPEDSPIDVPPNATVTIVDWVWITNGTTISFTLVEEWPAEMMFEGAEYTGGSIMSDTGWLDWYGYDLAPNTWHVITKTFQFTSTEWMTSTVTETLTVRYVEPLDPVMLEFPMGERYIYLPLVLKDF